MLIIKTPSTDAYLNIATEEYLLENKEEEIFLLYVNSPSIIVGKFQNTLAEINTPYVKKKGIKVVRRLTGGGAVYHDEGNLNFSFHMPYTGESFSDFKKFTQPIIDFLKTLDIKAELSGRNDLIVDDKKFSGNAKFIYKVKKLLQHGTILIDSEISELVNSLKVNPLKFKDKATQSVQSRVTNLIDYLPKEVNEINFADKLIDHIIKVYPNAKKYELTEEDLAGIEKLAKEKYATWEWNYGKSPSYNFQKKIRTQGGTIEFQLSIKEGIIKDANIYGDFFAVKPIEELENLLKNKRHEPDILALLLSTIKIEEYFGNVSVNELIEGLF